MLQEGVFSESPIAKATCFYVVDYLLVVFPSERDPHLPAARELRAELAEALLYIYIYIYIYNTYVYIYVVCNICIFVVFGH